MVPMQPIPPDVSAALTPEVAQEIAIYSDTIVFPNEILIYQPTDPDTYFLNYPHPVLVLMFENQGVVAWGVPLGVDRPPVLVGSDELPVTETAPNIETFIAARRWDAAAFPHCPTTIQAQAEPLPDPAKRFLDAHFHPNLTTYGWPGHTNLRYESDSARILLWLGEEQCDWNISAASLPELEATMRSLFHLSDLATSAWSLDKEGEQILNKIRGIETPAKQPFWAKFWRKPH